MERSSSSRPRALRIGLGAGVALGLADWAASGVLATPAILVLATLTAGALVGLVAGGIAAWLRRPALAMGLVLFVGIALEGLSIASKELAGAERAVAAQVVTITALVAVLALAWTWGAANGWLAHLGRVAALPAGAWLAARGSQQPLVHIAGMAAPLVWLATMHASRGRKSVRTAAWILLLAVLGAAQVRPGEPARRPRPASTAAGATQGPSIVLLVIDTLRADAVQSGGALARFARDGVEFRQCVSAAPWTLPAVGSLLTGLFPSQHGAVTTTTPLAEDVSTLAEVLAQRGYATAAFTGGAFVGASHRLDQGFETFDPSCERRFAPFGSHVPLVWRIAKNRYRPLRWLVRAVDESIGLAGVIDAAERWAAREPRRPKFLFLHTYQVHDYYIYDPDTDDPVLASRPPPSARFAGRLSVHPSELMRASQADLEHFRALYEGRLEAVERSLPELERKLTPHVGADAIWIVTSDHGEGFDANGPRVHHGGRLHDDLLRVPLVVRAPGRLAPGGVVEGPVRSIDVFPTVLDLAGVPVPAGLAGESLLPALRGEHAFPRLAFAEERASGFDLLAVRCDGWKWIRGPGHEELYRLSEDSLERTSLAGGAPAELLRELQTFPERYPARASPEIELDPATLEHLHALGYVH